MSKLLTIKEVSERLSVSTRTIQRWQDEGLISYVKVGGVVRFREEWLEKWIDNKTVKAKKVA